MMKDEVESLKLMIIGNYCGKTAFLKRYVNDHFSESENDGSIESYSKIVWQNEKKIKLIIQDSVGHERLWNGVDIRSKINGYIFMYDITSRKSLEVVSDRLNEIIQNQERENIAMVLVGNKSDLMDQRIISFEEGQLIAQKHDLLFFETSVKHNLNVDEVMKALVNKLMTIKPDTNNIKETTSN